MPANTFRTLSRPLVFISLVLVARAPASALCVGDCNDDAQVVVSELVAGVNVALERAEAATCKAFDGNNDDLVTIEELVSGVNHLLDECPFAIVYDPDNRRLPGPFPDDFWLVEDTATRTQLRLNVPIPQGPDDVQRIFTALVQDANALDGFSPIGHFVVELTDGVDPDSLPSTPTDSLLPSSSVRLYDLNSVSAFELRRVPVLVKARSDTDAAGMSHVLLIFPSVPLTPGGQYGLVLTRDMRARRNRHLRPSPFYSKVLVPAVAGEKPAVARARELTEEILAFNAVTVTRDDLALALHISIRSTEDIPNDLLAIKSQVLEAPPPAITITNVEPDPEGSPNVAALVHGTWRAPEWRDERTTPMLPGVRRLYLTRDDSGRPTQVTTKEVPFVIALPPAALKGPVPITMYQHGNPGSAEAEVPNTARRYLGAAGFAVTGFTDTLNRELSAGIKDVNQAILAQTAGVVFPLIEHHKVPDYWVETTAEQLAFLRMIQGGLGSLDVLPIGAPDGTPEIDTSAALTYVGISEGANNGPAFLPYAPEIRAAALVVGGARLAEVLIHQQPELFLAGLSGIFPGATPADIWVGFALFQTIFDIQDRHNHGSFLYRNPLNVAGTTHKASILLIEGLDDSLVPNHATNSLAWAIGPIPHLQPVQRAVPFLETTTGPVVANIDAQTTSAFYQYVPVGVPGIDPTPGCTVLSDRNSMEGHYCAQGAAESQHQRVVFFQTALTDEAPTIIDPLSEKD